MSLQDAEIMRSVKQLAKKECANYADGFCLLADRPCHVLNPAHKTIHDGTVDCYYFLLTVLPLDAELNTAIWHEIYREENQVGEGWKECVRCHNPFIPASNRQRYCASCGAAAKQARIRDKQRRYRERQKTTV